MKAVNLTTGRVVADDVTVACTVFSRMRGLLGRNGMAAGEALLIKPCKGIHTFGMRFAIDVIVLDKGSRVIAVRRGIVPNRMTAFYFGAASVLELSAGSVDKAPANVGDVLEIA